jgi:beta-phosphoglucomutase
MEPRNVPTADSAVIFDLDGVLADTAELHFQSWMDLSRELGIPFDRAANDALRGLSRADSLRLFLGSHAARFSQAEQNALMARKNEQYLARVADMGPGDLAAGARELLEELRRRSVTTAVASSSRNAVQVLERLGIRALLDTVVDGNDVPLSKPDPHVFLSAAERLGVAANRCVVVEDAASGVAAARAAGMKVVGIGPAVRVGGANLVIDSLSSLDAEGVLALLGTVTR